MEHIRAMIVDDSNFSIKVIKNILLKNDIEVAYTASSFQEAIEIFELNKDEIDFVTMDVTLPDGNGIECTKNLIRLKNDVDVIIVSAMMDEELIKNAQDSGAKSCIQKPINEEEMISKINRIFKGDELFKALSNNYESAFIESIDNYLTRVTKNRVKNSKYEYLDKIIPSKGISIALGLIGSNKGRFILDISKDTAKKLAQNAYDMEDISIEEITEYIIEATNVIAGNAVSLLNGLDRSYGIRVSPPTIFSGEDLEIFIGDINSSSLKFETVYGNVFVNVGFQRGKVEWM